MRHKGKAVSGLEGLLEIMVLEVMAEGFGVGTLFRRACGTKIYVDYLTSLKCMHARCCSLNIIWYQKCSFLSWVTVYGFSTTFDFDFSVLAKRYGWEEHPDRTYLVSNGTLNFITVNQFWITGSNQTIVVISGVQHTEETWDQKVKTLPTSHVNWSC